MKRLHKHTSDKHLTWSLLRDYFSNLLGNKEMHDVEKRVMQDPFNQDAFDGMENIAPASVNTDLANLMSRIERKTGYSNKNRSGFSVSWMRIAAIFFVVLISGSLIYYLTRTSITTPHDDIALNTRTEAPEEASRSLFTEEDKSTATDNISDSEAEIEVQEEFSESQKTKTDPAISPMVKKENETPAAGIQKSITVNDEIALADNEPVTENDESLELITAQSLTSTPDAQQLKSKLTTVAQQNININEVLFSEENEMAEEQESVQMAAESARIDTPVNVNESLRLSVQPEKTSMQSAVAAMPPIPINQYIENIKNNIKADFSDIEGEFELWFDVNADGTLENFDVTKSLKRRIDRNIIREVENSGNWKPAYIEGNPLKTRSTIVINFN